MSGKRFVGVIDIGKTNAKVAVVDLTTRQEVAMRKTANIVLADGLYPHFDIDGLWTFICAALAELNAAHRLDALSVTTHGACAALVDAAGALALPVLDYEFLGPDAVDEAYALVRPDFAESFTPPLPGGLNLGKQIFWQSRIFPEAFARTRWILTYPQYWSFRLTGVAASEITSLGCHTDLWDYELDLFSSLVRKEGWIDRFPEVRPASDVLGVVEPGLARRLGLDDGLPVYSGIHDSNASLLPHVLERDPPFSVVSTGTWVIVCSPGGDLGHLDPSRDCLANIDALGHHVPSSRFMGGREFSLLTGGEPRQPSPEAVDTVLGEPIVLLPSVVEGSGPFPDRKARWSHKLASLDADMVYATVSFYLAMVTAECLELTGAHGDIVVEGPFAQNPLFIDMLRAATHRPVAASTASATGTAIGAALLAQMEGHGKTEPSGVLGEIDPRLSGYAWEWRKALQEMA